MSRQNYPDTHKLNHTSHCFKQAHLQEAKERQTTYVGSARKVHASAASQMLSEIQEAASLGPTPGGHTHPCSQTCARKDTSAEPAEGAPLCGANREVIVKRNKPVWTSSGAFPVSQSARGVGH